MRSPSVKAGDTVVVIGQGLVGNFAAQIFQMAGADVMAVDLSDVRLAFRKLVVDPLRTLASPADCQEIYDGLTTKKDQYLPAVFDWSLLSTSLERYPMSDQRHFVVNEGCMSYILKLTWSLTTPSRL